MKDVRVTVDAVKELMQSGQKVCFLDVRNDRDWERSEIKVRGAVRIPVTEITGRLNEIPRDCPVVAY